jgi:hypothetical protein
MNYAVINSETNIVENVTIWDGVVSWAPPQGCYVQELTNPYAGIGWSFIGGEWIAPTTQPEA